MPGGRRALGLPACRHRACDLPVSDVGHLPVTRVGLRRVPRLSMGRAAARNRLSRHFPRANPIVAFASRHRTRSAAIAARAVAVAPAPVQTDVPIRLREDAEWRRNLAQPDRTHSALRNTTAADLDWLVRAPTSAL